MNRFSYRAYYDYRGPSHPDPLGTREMRPREVVDALARFPVELGHLLPPGSELDGVRNGRGSSYVTVVTVADASTIDGLVGDCLNALKLVGEKLHDGAEAEHVKSVEEAEALGADLLPGTN
jgi:hypothetical protein